MNKDELKRFLNLAIVYQAYDAEDETEMQDENVEFFEKHKQEVIKIIIEALATSTDVNSKTPEEQNVIPNCKMCVWAHTHNFGDWRCNAMGQIKVYKTEYSDGTYNSELCKYWYAHQVNCY